jgi:DNA-binding transcriptional ArsR family regulator
MKAEAHHRFEIGWKRQVIETIEQSKQLVAYGGASEIDAHQTRMREGWLEAVVDVDRWELLGFPDVPWNIELKCYQSAAWTEIPKSEPGHHPKIEASFSGVNDGKLPHVDEWDRTLQVLRQLVAAHLEWAGVDRGQLVADDYQDGPAQPEFSYGHPTGRREQLQERYESVATEIYREATKMNTKAVYDILRVTATEQGATYDVLEERTGLARSTIRYHVRRLQDSGVVDRVGNPVIVVFPSIEVLDQAAEILRTIFPGESIDEIEERADERRENREQRDDPDGVDVDDETDDDSSSSSSRSDWRYFSDVDVEPHQLANALERDYLDDDELRVRVDRRDWLIDST